MKKTTFFLAILLSKCLFAQDSIKVQQVYQHTYYNKLLQNFNKQPFLFFITPFENYTNSLLFYQKKTLDKTKKQEANQIDNIVLKANGIYRNNKVLFTGGIRYQKNYLKEIGYNLSNLYPYKNEVEQSPIYNVAYQEGNWSNQFYKLNATIVTPLIKNKLYASFAIDYRTLQFFRQDNNPVPKLTYLFIAPKISLYYKFNPHNYVGISANYGSLENKINIAYIGSSSKLNIPIYPEIYHRLSYGYGILESAVYSNYKEKDKQFGGNISHILKSKDNLITTIIGYKRTKTYYSYGNEEILLANYTVDKYIAKFNWYNWKKGNSIFLNLNYTNGSNFRVSTNGLNYKANLFNFNTTYQKKNQKGNIIKNNYGVTLGLSRLEKIDYQSVNNFNYTNTKVSFFYGKDFKTTKTSKTYTKGGFAGKFLVDKKASFNQKNNFINQVAIPDYNLNTANKLYLNMEVGYQKKIKIKTYANFGCVVNTISYLGLNSSDNNQKGFNKSFQVYLKLSY